jgi:hypothetical protein
LEQIAPISGRSVRFDGKRQRLIFPLLGVLRKPRILVGRTMQIEWIGLGDGIHGAEPFIYWR